MARDGVRLMIKKMVDKSKGVSKTRTPLEYYISSRFFLRVAIPFSDNAM